MRLMDGRDGWHVAGSNNKTIINPVMLRFRPIAPKPATGGSFSGGISPENTSAVLRTSKRVKRKYVRVRKENNNNHNNNERRRRRNSDNNTRSSEEERESGLNSTTLTLQLMPEKSDGYDFIGSNSTRSWCIIDPYRTVEAVHDHENDHQTNGEVSNRTAVVIGSVMAEAAVVVESWVTVESVADTCMDVRGLGCTDVERIKNLERDTCPGFLSDGYFSKVEWVNEAYKKMLVEVEAEEERLRRWPEVVVRLIGNNNNNNTNNKVGLGLMGPAFTCRVRVQYTRMNKEKSSKIMPCDVWRMDSGRFAWRLDVKAALSLGL